MELKRYLRLVASTGDDGDDYSMVEISNRRAREAADRIEKLEAALAEIAKINNRRDRFSSEIDAIIVNALGDKNEDA